MPFFPKTPQIIGIELCDSQKLRICLLSHKKKWIIDRLETLDFSTLHDKNKISNLHASHISWSTSVDSRYIWIRPLDLPLKRKKDIEAALCFQAEPLLPYPLEKCILQYSTISRHSMGTLLNLYAIKKEHLSNHLDELKKNDIDPEIVHCTPESLASLTELFENKDLGKSYLVLHIGNVCTTFLVMENGKLLASRFFLLPKKEIYTESYKAEVRKALLSFEIQFKGKTFENLVIIGVKEDEISYFESFTNKKGVAPKICSLSLDQLNDYSIAIGTAFASAKKGINFRQYEDPFLRRWKQLKKPLVTYLGLCAFLTIIFFSLGRVYLQNKLKELQQEYVSFLADEGTNYDNFETHMNKKMPPSSLSLKDIENRVVLFEKQIKQKPNTFPLYPLIPKVRDLIAWLESHPLIANESREIIIDNLRYQMVKRPLFDKKNEKYLVKIDLQFTANQSGAARAFHEFLRSPNPFVNLNYEVQWSVSHGKYRATFFLKDLTSYR